MVTEAQIRANQENAQKSTGPISIEGKKKSSMNYPQKITGEFLMPCSSC